MQHRVIEVDVERCAGGDTAPDEGVGAGEVFAVDIAAHLQGQLLEVFDRSRLWCLRRQTTSGRGRDRRAGRRATGTRRSCAGCRTTRRTRDRSGAPGLVADVPLAIDGGGVAGPRQDVAHGLLPGHQTARQPRQLHGAVARADGVAAGQQRRPGRRALGFGREIEQLQPLPGEAVQPRCFCAAQDASAVTAQLTHAEIVDVDIENVGWPGRAGSPEAQLERCQGSSVTSSVVDRWTGQFR